MGGIPGLQQVRKKGTEAGNRWCIMDGEGHMSCPNIARAGQLATFAFDRPSQGGWEGQLASHRFQVEFG